MQPNVLLIIAFVSLLVSAGSYFFAKIKILSFTLFLFYTCNTFLSSLLFLNHPLLFCIIGIFFIALPIICLILFALDTHYALFCIDTSFVFMIVWPFIAMFFFHKPYLLSLSCDPCLMSPKYLSVQAIHQVIFTVRTLCPA